MKILGIETSSKLCGACILEDENLIDKLEIDNGLTHSETLMPLIKNLLEKNDLKISDFDAFVCDIGPGSFTGIRIDVATAMAFIDCSKSAKYTGVSSLEALAYNVKNNGYIASVIDCKNDNCYFALYKLQNGDYTEIIPPTASSVLEMAQVVKKYEAETITFVGDGAVVYKNEIAENVPNSIFVNECLNAINTANLALAGLQKISSGEVIELTPLYLKKPQAERQLEEKMKLKI